MLGPSRGNFLCKSIWGCVSALVYVFTFSEIYLDCNIRILCIVLLYEFAVIGIDMRIRAVTGQGLNHALPLKFHNVTLTSVSLM